VVRESHSAAALGKALKYLARDHTKTGGVENLLASQRLNVCATKIQLQVGW
jgi:hypothetical protein